MSTCVLSQNILWCDFLYSISSFVALFRAPQTVSSLSYLHVGHSNTRSAAVVSATSCLNRVHRYAHRHTAVDTIIELFSRHDKLTCDTEKTPYWYIPYLLLTYATIISSSPTIGSKTRTSDVKNSVIWREMLFKKRLLKR